MIRTLSFTSMVNTCQVLGKFAEARSGPRPNKNLILAVRKIEGRDELKLIKLSNLNWFSRVIRWFGFGPASLGKVATFLQNQEPYLPRKKFCLCEDTLKSYYIPEDVEKVLTLERGKFKKLQRAYARGCDR